MKISPHTKGGRGFTLIELLVVIAIIGILATLVLVSLNSARDKAKDVAVKGAFRQAKAIAELIYSDTVNNYSYVNVCDGSNQIKISGTPNYDAQATATRVNIRANNNGSLESCYSSATAFCLVTTLKATGTRWCIDSTAYVGTPIAGGCGDAVTHNLCTN